MNGSLIQILVTSFLAMSVLTACGGSPRPKSPRAVGVNSRLGQLLTSVPWCSAPAESTANPAVATSYTKLEVRQNAEYIKTIYNLKLDTTRETVGVERGTWGLVGDQFFTRVPRGLSTRLKVAESATNVPPGGSSPGIVLAQDPPVRASDPILLAPDAFERCLNLTDAAGTRRTFCPCAND